MGPSITSNYNLYMISYHLVFQTPVGIYFPPVWWNGQNEHDVGCDKLALCYRSIQGYMCHIWRVCGTILDLVSHPTTPMTCSWIRSGFQGQDVDILSYYCRSLGGLYSILTVMRSHMGAIITSNYTPDLLSTLARPSLPSESNKNIYHLQGDGVVQVQGGGCRYGYAIPLLHESWRLPSSYLTGRME